MLFPGEPLRGEMFVKYEDREQAKAPKGRLQAGADNAGFQGEPQRGEMFVEYEEREQAKAPEGRLYAGADNISALGNINPLE